MKHLTEAERELLNQANRYSKNLKQKIQFSIQRGCLIIKSDDREFRESGVTSFIKENFHFIDRSQFGQNEIKTYFKEIN